jgi:glycosyltransferase involved in cell wall biosynthesis
VSRRPRLLFLCQTLPYPPDGGVWIRTYHVLRLLARTFDVTALCFERAGSAGECDREASRAALARLAEVEVFAIPQRHSRLRFAWDHARSLARGHVYTTYLYESSAFRRRLEERVRSESFDLVHVDSLDLAAYLPALGDLPVVCVHHDVESALLRRRAALERSRGRAAYLAHQARLMDTVERHWCDRVALNVAVSESDAALLRGKAPAARVAVVPNGVDMDEFRPDGTAGAGVAFVGGTNPFPNLDALEILPHLRAAGGAGPVRWIGRASAAQQQAYRAAHDVDLTGYTRDVRPLMGAAACHVVPLRVGGGTRLKILNSWAMGKPVVTTSIGCEGLAAQDGVNLLVRDRPEDFAAAILRVLRDGDLRRRLGEAGRETAQRLYSWEVVGHHMTDLYCRVAGGPEPGRARVREPIRVQPSYSHS